VVQVRTDRGSVSGADVGGAVRFRSIPYAAPPFGANRFRAPQPVAEWDGVRDGTVLGVGAPQGRFDGDPFDAYFNPVRQGEDCLTLDVWTPDPGTSGLPVMVWIHGGGFITGTGSAPAHDGTTFARDGIVHVGINYRLGIEGFISFDDGTENLGLRDQVAALDWVQRNIAAFGGDPANVTVFGQSAGAVAVMDLLVMPSARGLFARAIAMSGPPVVGTDVEGARRVTRRLAERFGVEPTREAFAAIPLERTIAETIPMEFEFVDWHTWGAEAFTVTPYRAVYGTESLPVSPNTSDAGFEVPLMTGTMRNEASGFLSAIGLMPDIPAVAAQEMQALMGADDAILRSYREGPRHLTTDLELTEAVWTDWAFRIPTLALVEARRAPTHVYEFLWESPSFPPHLGANHAFELPFMRDDLAAMRAAGPAGEAVLGADAPQELATRMHRAFADYARTGRPGWPEYDTTDRSTMVFDTVSGLQQDPAATARQAWEGKR
jgi:carboxylesterase type B